jgi:hypothetical protein
VRTCCCIHHVLAFAVCFSYSFRRLSLHPSYWWGWTKWAIGWVSWTVRWTLNLVHNCYLTAPPAIVLVTVGFSRIN